ncbi:hypothetical protein AgCh_037378 [Apium graveolens]
MASPVAEIVFLILILSTAVPSFGKDYTVGELSGWALGVDYDTWASDKTFNVGDSLVFKYGTSHTVDEVSSSDYSSCTIGNSITADNTGSTTIPLKTVCKHYFICGVIDHCSGGMKLAVLLQLARDQLLRHQLVLQCHLRQMVELVLLFQHQLQLPQAMFRF